VRERSLELSRSKDTAEFRLPALMLLRALPHDAFARREESIRRVAIASSQVPVTPVLSDPGRKK
jgi:hypothetical protein